MKPKNALLLGVAASILLAPALAGPASEPLAEEALGIIHEFHTQLGGAVKGVMGSGGAVSAVAFCQESAQPLAKALSDKTGWQFGRTSLKPRNPANTPDAWETAVMRKFEERKAAGEAIESLTFAEVIEDDNGKTYRFMKAIPTVELCVTCHGANIDSAVTAAIEKGYPDDQARGFAVGDLRGAFTLVKPL